MNEPWKLWEGQTVDQKFQLCQFLAATDHSAVFLTRLTEAQPRDAVIKFIPADSPTAESRLSLWQCAGQLEHANLLSIYAYGRCRLDDRDLLYVVMEFAEENLAEILPQRPLSPDEARDVLTSAFGVLTFLHDKGFAHAHIKPSNVLATRDFLKLSSDSLQSIGAPHVLNRPADVYDAPELVSGPVSPKADVWSLAATLFAALTQRPPELPQDSSLDPAIPENLPALFRDIASHSLRRDVMRRWSVADVAARLNPAPLAAVAAVAAAAPAMAPPAKISPLNVPLAKEPAVPLAKLHAPATSPLRRETPKAKPRQFSPVDYLVPLLLGAAVFIGLILALPKIFNFRGQPASSVAATSSDESVAPAPQPVSPKPTQTLATSSPKEELSEKPSVAEPSAKQLTPKPAASPLAPASLRTDPASPVRPKPATDSVDRGEVLDQALPQASSQALATIHGTVRVVVKVQVDAAGNVTGSELDSPGPSRYFAGLAEKAARQWKFTGAEADGHGVPSEWQIRFEFASSGVHAFPKQTSP